MLNVLAGLVRRYRTWLDSDNLIWNPHGDKMRRRVDGKWEYRDLTEDERGDERIVW